MKMLRNIAILFTVSTLLAASAASGVELRASWNFNDISAPPASLMSTSHGAGAMTTNWDIANIANFTGSGINLVGADIAGRDIAFQNGVITAGIPANEGRWIQFQIDMTGFYDLRFSYAGRGTAAGMRDLTWSWSVDGTSFTNFRTVDHVALLGVGVYGLVNTDMSAIAAVNNQPAVFIRGTFATQPGQVAPGSLGNNRFDNVQFTAIPEPSTYAMIFGALALIGVFIHRRRKVAA